MVIKSKRRGCWELPAKRYVEIAGPQHPGDAIRGNGRRISRKVFSGYAAPVSATTNLTSWPNSGPARQELCQRVRDGAVDDWVFRWRLRLGGGNIFDAEGDSPCVNIGRAHTRCSGFANRLPAPVNLNQSQRDLAAGLHRVSCSKTKFCCS